MDMSKEEISPAAKLGFDIWDAHFNGKIIVLEDAVDALHHNLVEVLRTTPPEITDPLCWKFVGLRSIVAAMRDEVLSVEQREKMLSAPVGLAIGESKLPDERIIELVLSLMAHIFARSDDERALAVSIARQVIEHAEAWRSFEVNQTFGMDK